MYKVLLLALVSFCFRTLNAQVPQHSYHVKNKVTVYNIDNDINRMALILPLPQTNQYQTISNVNVYGGVTSSIPETDDSYVRWTFTKDLPSKNESKDIYYDFDVTLNSIDFDFSSITTIYPYDSTSENYRWYTGANGAYVDPNNPVIQETGKQIWAESSDILDYAHRCYEYVAQNYRYLNPFTGLHKLKDILEAGGGDCGNLSSIYISLLRYKKIPARHIVTVRPDGVYHVWADFYLEKYGWIPVDVTFKNSNPSGNFFGVFDGNGIVMTKEVWIPIDKGNGETYYGDILQSYNLWIWANQGSTVKTSHVLSSIPYSGAEDKPIITDISGSQNALAQ